jgi:signal transduction histidine kinase
LAAEPAQRHRGRPWRGDALVGVGLVALVVAESALRPQGASTLSGALTALLVATVAVRRVDPALACAAALLPLLMSVALDAPLVYELAYATAYVVLAWWVAVEGRLLSYAALVALTAATLVVMHQDSPGNEGMLVGVVALAALAGRAWAVRDRQGRVSAATATGLRAVQEAAAERAVRTERLRLARELHDVASHAVGVMVLQAGAALALRERDPDAARSSVRSIQAAGVEAMSELDVLFGVLDAGAIGTAGIAGAVAGEDVAEALTALVARMRSGGLDVSFDHDGCAVDHPMVASTAFRIVQEALTNAARYAPRSRVEVSIRSDEDGVAVTVSDDGPGPASHDAGFGLVGLAERVRSLGGELAAGRESGGGFAIRARLPVAPGSGRGA